MFPSSVPSDSEIDEMSPEELGSRWSILLDLYNEFQGAAIAYAVMALLLPALVIASIVFGWYAKYSTARLIAAGFLFVGFVSISLYSWVWFFWVRRRLKRVEKNLRMQRPS